MKQQVPELITLSEASQILKVQTNTLRKWDRKGILKAVRFGERGDRR
jgi:excisionase family DNA binding protein